MPHIKGQRIDKDIVRLEPNEGAPLEILQADNRKWHSDHQGSKADKDQAVIDRVKVLCYERMGEVPSVFEVELDPDGTVANIIIT